MKTMLLAILLGLGIAAAPMADKKPAPKPEPKECKNPGESCSSSSDCCWRNTCSGGVCVAANPNPPGDTE